VETGSGLDLVRIIGDEVLVDLGLLGFAFKAGGLARSEFGQEAIAARPLAGMVMGQEHGQLQIVALADFLHSR